MSAAWIVRRLTKWNPAPRVRRVAWIVVLAATEVVIVAAVGGLVVARWPGG